MAISDLRQQVCEKCQAIGKFFGREMIFETPKGDTWWAIRCQACEGISFMRYIGSGNTLVKPTDEIMFYLLQENQSLKEQLLDLSKEVKTISKEWKLLE